MAEGPDLARVLHQRMSPVGSSVIAFGLTENLLYIHHIMGYYNQFQTVLILVKCQNFLHFNSIQTIHNVQKRPEILLKPTLDSGSVVNLINSFTSE